jgi:hypothetical protein
VWPNNKKRQGFVMIIASRFRFRNVLRVSHAVT